MPPDRQCQIKTHKIHREKGLDVRLSLTLSSITIPSRYIIRFSSVKFPKEGMNVVSATVGLLYNRWKHHQYPPPQFRHGTESEVNILQPPTLVVSATKTHKTFGPTDLTSTYCVSTRGVFGDVGHRTQAF
ncbi:hypothetical protein TNCV_3002931 [Trichonephila clavipes]|nr:hypothetical protein TNCV_3002931 [Trichonephila clavipes]